MLLIRSKSNAKQKVKNGTTYGKNSRFCGTVKLLRTFGELKSVRLTEVSVI